MAEDTTSVAAAVDGTDEEETQGQSSTQGIERDQVWSPEELREQFRAVVREENAAAWNEMRRTIMPMQTQLAEMAPKIEGLLPQIAAVQGDAEATRQLVIDVLSGVELDAEQLQAIKDAKRLDTQQRAAARQQQEQAQHQRELEEAKKAQLSPEQLRQIRFTDAWGIVDDDLNQYSKEQGFRDFGSVADDVKSVVGAEIPVAWMVPADEFGLKRWRREARKAILAKAAARDADGNATVNVPSLRGGGGQSEQEYQDRFGAGELPYTPENVKKARELQAKGILARARS